MPDALERLLTEALVHEVPLSVLFELTNRCNHRCAHCYVDVDDAADELTTDEALAALDQLRAAGTLFLTLSGGEIFTRSDALELARRARTLGFALRLFTNGTLLDAARADALAEIGPLAVEISLYSMDPARHDRVTGTWGAQARTVSAVRLLRDRGVTVCLKAPLLTGRADEFHAVLRFAREVGAECKFDPKVVAGAGGDAAPFAHRLTSAELAAVCREPELGLATPPDAQRVLPPDEAPCAAARRTALISSRGLVFPCSQRFPPAGSLRAQTFREIWETAPLLLRLRNITLQDLPWCRDCAQAPFCGRCPLDAAIEDGDFFGPSGWAGAFSQARLAAYKQGGVTADQEVARRFGARRPVCEL